MEPSDSKSEPQSDEGPLELKPIQFKHPYPKSVIFIIGNEFCERFSYYGMRTILILYLIKRLQFNDNSATMAFHVFAMACYFTPLLGAIVADSYLGRYWTILSVSCIYAAGSIIIAFASINGSSTFSIIGLALIALGTGGIKPCVSAFGGDQFRRGQETQLQRFFSLFYLAINSGSLLSTFMTPILREDVGCMGRMDCYPLAFGIPAILMVIAVGLFILGRFVTDYRIIPPQKNNIIVTVCRCVFRALIGKCSPSTPKKDHWLDHASEHFDEQTIHDVKTLMRILFLYIPIPIFWALFDQQSSRWTLQANRMNGNLGFYMIKPDQIQVINPILIVLFIPIFDNVIYPIFNRIGLNKPLRRMVLGGIFAGLAFMACAFVQMKIEKEAPVSMLDGHNHLMIINAKNKTISFDKNFIGLNENSSVEIPYGSLYIFPNVPREKLKLNITFLLVNDKTVIFFYSDFEENPFMFSMDNTQTKPDGSGAQIFTVFNLKNVKNETNLNQTGYFHATEINNLNSTFIYKNDNRIVGILQPFMIDVKGKEISMSIGDIWKKLYKLEQGATYVQLITGDFQQEVTFFLNKVVNENQLSVFIQVFQYVLITAAEIMFSVTGLEFSYSQAPKSMKSVIQAAWLLMVSFGDLLVAVIADVKLFEKQSNEFIFFGVLMFVDIGLFAWIACLYIPYSKVIFDADDDFQIRSRVASFTTSINGDLPKLNFGNPMEHEVDEKDLKYDPTLTITSMRSIHSGVKL